MHNASVTSSPLTKEGMPNTDLNSDIPESVARSQRPITGCTDHEPTNHLKGSSGMGRTSSIVGWFAIHIVAYNRTKDI
jgi:hypothetical protein